MLKRRWSVQFRGVQGRAIITYDDKERLESVDISELYEQEDYRAWMWNWWPKSVEALIEVSHKLTGDSRIRIDAILEDLSFERFWEEYDNKIGKKNRAKKLWEALSDQDKNRCLNTIPKYKYYLALRPHIQCLYPETFLSQRRFENEFKVKE